MIVWSGKSDGGGVGSGVGGRRGWVSCPRALFVVVGVAVQFDRCVKLRFTCNTGLKLTLSF